MKKEFDLEIIAKLSSENSSNESIFWGNDDTSLITGGKNGVVKMWEYKNNCWTCIKELETNGSNIELGPDKKTMISLTEKKINLCNDINEKNVNFKQIEKADYEISNPFFSPDGKILGFCSDKSSLYFFKKNEKMQWRPIFQLYDDSKSWCKFITFNFDGTIIIRIATKNLICLDTFENEKRTTVEELFDYSGNIQALAANPKDNSFVTGTNYGVLYLWQIVDKKIKKISIFPTGSSNISYLIFGPNGKSFVSIHNYKEIKMWNIENNTIQPFLTTGLNGDNIYCLKFSPSGKYLAMGCETWNNEKEYILIVKNPLYEKKLEEKTIEI